MEKQKPLLLDQAPFPVPQINYMNGPTMKSIKRLHEQLGKLKKALQG